MNVPRISHELTPEQYEAIMQAIRALDANLDFAVNLTPEDRQKIRRLGAKKRVFTKDAHAFCQEKTSTVPNLLDMTEFSKDLKLSTQLYDISNILKTMAEKIQDTAAAAGWQAFRRARQYHVYIKELAKTNEPGCETIEKELDKFFARGKYRKENVKKDNVKKDNVNEEKNKNDEAIEQAVS